MFSNILEKTGQARVSLGLTLLTHPPLNPTTDPHPGSGGLGWFGAGLGDVQVTLTTLCVRGTMGLISRAAPSNRQTVLCGVRHVAGACGRCGSHV